MKNMFAVLLITLLCNICMAQEGAPTNTSTSQRITTTNPGGGLDFGNLYLHLEGGGYGMDRTSKITSSSKVDDARADIFARLGLTSDLFAFGVEVRGNHMSLGPSSFEMAEDWKFLGAFAKFFVKRHLGPDDDRPWFEAGLYGGAMVDDDTKNSTWFLTQFGGRDIPSWYAGLEFRGGIAPFMAEICVGFPFSSVKLETMWYIQNTDLSGGLMVHGRTSMTFGMPMHVVHEQGGIRTEADMDWSELKAGLYGQVNFETTARFRLNIFYILTDVKVKHWVGGPASFTGHGVGGTLSLEIGF